MSGHFNNTVAVTVAACALSPRIAAAAPSTPPAANIPLCPGLTVVTAISQREGDYESITTIESVDASGIRLRYLT